MIRYKDLRIRLSLACPSSVDGDRKVWVLRWPTLIQFNGKAIPTAEKLYVKFTHSSSFPKTRWIPRSTDKKQHKEHPRCAYEKIDAARYYIHGRLILLTERSCRDISRPELWSRSYNPRGEKKTRSSRIESYSGGDKALRCLKTSNYEEFLSILQWYQK